MAPPLWAYCSGGADGDGVAVDPGDRHFLVLVHGPAQVIGQRGLRARDDELVADLPAAGDGVRRVDAGIAGHHAGRNGSPHRDGGIARLHVVGVNEAGLLRAVDAHLAVSNQPQAELERVPGGARGVVLIDLVLIRGDGLGRLGDLRRRARLHHLDQRLVVLGELVIPGLVQVREDDRGAMGGVDRPGGGIVRVGRRPHVEHAPYPRRGWYPPATSCSHAG